MKPLTFCYKNAVSKKQGFTLIELLVVVAIIGLLAAIFLPKMSQALETARQGRTVQRLTSLRTASNMYYLDHHSMPGNNNEYPFQIIQLFHYDENGVVIGCQFPSPHPKHWYIEGRKDEWPEEVGDGPQPGYTHLDYCSADGSWHANRSVQGVDDGNTAGKGGWSWCGGDPTGHVPLSGTLWIDENVMMFGGKTANQY